MEISIWKVNKKGLALSIALYAKIFRLKAKCIPFDLLTFAGFSPTQKDFTVKVLVLHLRFGVPACTKLLARVHFYQFNAYCENLSPGLVE